MNYWLLGTLFPFVFIFNSPWVVFMQNFLSSKSKQMVICHCTLYVQVGMYKEGWITGRRYAMQASWWEKNTMGNKVV